AARLVLDVLVDRERRLREHGFDRRRQRDQIAQKLVGRLRDRRGADRHVRFLRRGVAAAAVGRAALRRGARGPDDDQRGCPGDHRDEAPRALHRSSVVLHVLQQETHLWLFLDPSFSSSATVSGNGDTRCTGPFAMSATVWPLRATAVTSAPFDTRYMIISLSP